MIFQFVNIGSGTYFGEILNWFERMGGYEVVLPFLLIFTVIFALLQKIKILGTDKGGEPRKNLNITLAFILSLIFITQTDLVLYLYSFLPKVSLAILAGLMFLMLIGLFSKDSDVLGFTHIIAVFISIIALIWALIPENLLIGWPVWLWLSDTDKAVIVTIALFVLVIWFVVREPEKEGKGWMDGLKNFEKFLTGK